MHTLRPWIVFGWIALPTVMYGGYSLLRLINRLIACDSGDVRVQGAPARLASQWVHIDNPDGGCVVTYWMNKLQHLPQDRPPRSPRAPGGKATH